MKRIIYYLILILYNLNTIMSSTITTNTNTTSSMNSTEEETVLDTQTFVIYTFPMLIIVGTVCNILTFLVMRRKKLRNQSTGFYMAVLAIADELALLVGCLSHWLYSYKEISILLVSTVSCKIFCVVLYTTLDFSVWMVVIMTIERFIAVTFPLKSMYFCTVKKAKIATMILICILLSINAQFLFTHSLVQRAGDQPGCQPVSEYDYFMHNVWPWVDATKYSFIPLITILLFNVLIIYNLVKASTSIKNLSSNHKLKINSHAIVTTNTVRKSSTSNQYHLTPAGSHTNVNLSQHNSPSIGGGNTGSSSSSSSSNNRRLTIMLLVVSITFCILSTPLMALQILEKANVGSRYKTFYTFCLLLQYFNHSTNFFLYVISGKLFRREFIALFSDSLICFKSKVINKSTKNSMFSDSVYSKKANSSVMSKGYMNIQNKKNNNNKNIRMKSIQINGAGGNISSSIDHRRETTTFLVTDRANSTSDRLLSVSSAMTINNEIDNEPSTISNNNNNNNESVNKAFKN